MLPNLWLFSSNSRLHWLGSWTEWWHDPFLFMKKADYIVFPPGPLFVKITKWKLCVIQSDTWNREQMQELSWICISLVCLFLSSFQGVKRKCCPPLCLSRDEWRKNTSWKYQDKFQFECLFFPFVILLSVSLTSKKWQTLPLSFSDSYIRPEVSLTNEKSWSHLWQTVYYLYMLSYSIVISYCQILES